jgi:iron complex outermembrane receptor protein
MKSVINCVRWSVLSAALCGAYSAYGQAYLTGTLKEIVVTANGFSESAQTLPYGVSVITAKEIESSGAASVSEALMKVLGIPGRLDTSGANNYAVDLRGFGETAGSNQVVIVDGRRLNEQDQSGSNLSVISIDSVQRIEVIRGSAAVVFGEGATGGAIVITTKAGSGLSRHNAAVISASTGTFGLQEYRTSATLVAGGLSLDLYANERKSDGHRDNFASINNAAGATVQWSNDWLRLGAQSSRSMLRSGFPGSLTAVQYEADPHQTHTPLDYGQLKSEVNGLFVEANIANWQLGVDFGERSKNSMAFYDMGGGFSYSSSTKVSANNTNLRARNDTKGGSFSNTFTLGIDLSDWKYNNDDPSSGKSESTGLYLTDDITYPATGTRLSVGVRNESIRKSRDTAIAHVDDVQTAWQLGLTQTLGEGVHAYTRVGQSFRFANVDDINAMTPGSPLKAQTSRDVELGVRWHYATGRTELRWYRSDLNNEIGYDKTAIGPHSADPSFPFDGANINFDPTRREGLELEARHELTAAVALRLNAAARQARFVSGQYADKDVSLVPAHTMGLGLDWNVAAGHLVNLGVTWVSSQSPDFANKCTIPAYSTVDARYAFSQGPAELALGVSNLGDSKYYTQAYGCSAAGVTSAIYPEAGRAFTATAKLKF